MRLHGGVIQSAYPCPQLRTKRLEVDSLAFTPLFTAEGRWLFSEHQHLHQYSWQAVDAIFSSFTASFLLATSTQICSVQLASVTVVTQTLIVWTALEPSPLPSVGKKEFWGQSLQGRRPKEELSQELP